MDKPQDIGLDSKSQRDKDVIDYNHELAGGENGRIKRFSVDSQTYLNTEEQEKRKAQKQQFTSMLAYMLENDAQYRQLYFEVEAKLEEAQSQVGEALLKINKELDDIQLHLENADELGLSEEERLKLRRRKEELERHRQEIEEYQRDVLDPVQQRMNDKDNPPTKEEFQNFQDMIGDKKPEYLAELRASEKALGSVSAGIDGETEFFNPRQLCNQFCKAHDDNRTVKVEVGSQDEPNFAPLN